MMQPNRSTYLTAALIAALTGAQTAAAQSSWKLYDLRDLISTLPPVTDPVNGEQNVDDLVHKVCTELGLNYLPLVPGVYGIEAEEAEHAHLQHLLEAVRALFNEQYAVEILLYKLPTGKAPAIGDAAEANEPLHRHQLVVPRRTPVPLTLTSGRGYVSDVTAVVATSSAAYEPEVDEIDEGLDVSLVVGAGHDDDQSVSLNLVGELRRVSWSDGMDLRVPQDGPMRIEHPLLSVRSVRSNLEVPYEKPTVVCVLAGFADHECIVLAATIRKLQ